MPIRLHPDSAMRNELGMYTSAVAIRQWLDSQLDDPNLQRLKDVRTHETLARMGVLEGKNGRLMVGVRHLIRAGAAEHRLDWVLSACALPLLRMPGRGRLLALRRHLIQMRRPSRSGQQKRNQSDCSACAQRKTHGRSRRGD